MTSGRCMKKRSEVSRLCVHSHVHTHVAHYPHAHILQRLTFHMEFAARVRWHLRWWTFKLRHGFVCSNTCKLDV